MLALDNGDKIQGDTTTASKVDFTLHGFVGTVATQLADGQLANSIGDLYTAGAAGIGVSSIILVNTNSSAEAVNLYLTPSGGTARRIIPEDLSLAAGYSLVTDGMKFVVMNTSGEILTSGSTGPAPDGQIFLSAAGGWGSTTSGAASSGKVEFATNDVDMYFLDFDKDSDEFAQWTLVMPSDWDAGTVTGTFYWTTASGEGGAAETVQWALQGRAYANDDAIDQAWGTAVSVSDTWIADEDVHVSSATGAITLAGSPAANQLVQFRAYRDVSEDDLGGDARLIGIMVAFTRS